MAKSKESKEVKENKVETAKEVFDNAVEEHIEMSAKEDTKVVAEHKMHSKYNLYEMLEFLRPLIKCDYTVKDLAIRLGYHFKLSPTDIESLYVSCRTVDEFLERVKAYVK